MRCFAIDARILTFLILISCANYTLAQGPPNRPGKKTKAQGKNVTLNDLWKDFTFKSASVHGLRSMNNGMHYTAKESEDGESFIVRYQYETGKVIDTLVRSSWLIPDGSKDTLSIDAYQFSPDESKIMIATGTEKIYRHSTRESNYIWDISKKKLSALDKDGKQRYATFSPSGLKVAYVNSNNVFVMDLAKGNKVQITNDGEFNKIINGATDWVYEEEFSFDKAFFWSPDGKKIAYYRFDESNVMEFSMAKYGSLYPFEYRFKYPKAGEQNSTVSIHIHNLNSSKVVKYELDEGYEYIPRIKWTNDPNLLSIQKKNRHQNKMQLVTLDASSGSVSLVLEESCKTYFDVTDNLTFLKDGKTFIWTSDKDGFNHIYHYDLQGKLIHQVTVGNWEVTKFMGYDEESNALYYEAASSMIKNSTQIKEQKGADYLVHHIAVGASGEAPLERHLFVTNLEGTKKRQLSRKVGVNSAKFSKGFKYYINYHSAANSPNHVTLHKSSGEQIRILEDNSKLIKTMGEYNLTEKDFFTFETSEKVELNGWMIKPANFDPSKKYPVFMYVYGGPGSQTVRDVFDGRNYFWYQMLAQKGYIIISVDNRGTGARGADFKKCTYKELGKLETIDQIETAKYIGTLPYVDSKRIGIWGWSYGGYMTSLCLTKGDGLFKMGIAIAPVTNWRFYDTIYTERYMQTPQENASGYDDNSPINHVENLQGKYLLVHGSADDNVHYQNTLEMTSALVDADKQFDLFIYPDKAHSIYGGNTRLHLYTKMTNFILENL
ncbi:MAG: S9 family peptidase [Bacteroidetes bacterium]|nr:MAG: S9 family peptidase [Bacteroidota bacterium]